MHARGRNWDHGIARPARTLFHIRPKEGLGPLGDSRPPSRASAVAPWSSTIFSSQVLVGSRWVGLVLRFLVCEVLVLSCHLCVSRLPRGVFEHSLPSVTTSIKPEEIEPLQLNTLKYGRISSSVGRCFRRSSSLWLTAPRAPLSTRCTCALFTRRLFTAIRTISHRASPAASPAAHAGAVVMHGQHC